MFRRSVSLIVTSTIVGCLAIAAVVLRFFALTKRRTGFGADDVLIFFGLVLALGLCICNVIGAALFRFGDHEIFIESGPLEGWPEAWELLAYGKVTNNMGFGTHLVQIFYAIQLLHTTAMPVIKASLLLFMRRIFGHAKLFRKALWVVGIYVGLWWLSNFWMSVFQCWPISSNWGTTPEQMGDCIPNYMTWYAWAAVLNVVSDVAIIIIPVPLVLRLQMPTKQKLATLAVLATAVIVVVAGIGRSVSYFTYDHESLDFSYVFYNFLIWTSVEPCLGIVGCCLPTLVPLMGAIDVKTSMFYWKIKSVFSKSSSIDRITAESRRDRSDQRTAWITLTDNKGSQPEHIDTYKATPSIEPSTQRSQDVQL